MSIRTEQDMRTISTGFHLIEVHTKTALWGGTLLLLVGALGVGAYLMWRRTRRQAAAREGARRLQARMEQQLRLELGGATSLGEGMSRLDLRDDDDSDRPHCTWGRHTCLSQLQLCAESMKRMALGLEVD